MNEVNKPINPTPPINSSVTPPPTQPLVTPPVPKEHSVGDLGKLIWAKFRFYFLGTIILVALILVAFYGFRLYKNAQRRQMEAADRQIRDQIFALRLSARDYYDRHFNYQNWEPGTEAKAKITAAGSDLVVKHPDFQSYMMYARYISDNGYFCADSTGFANDIRNEPSNGRTCQ